MGLPSANRSLLGLRGLRGLLAAGAGDINAARAVAVARAAWATDSRADQDRNLLLAHALVLDLGLAGVAGIVVARSAGHAGDGHGHRVLA
eukprot:13661811-Alexandrium_andersonii.AAC.1